MANVEQFVKVGFSINKATSLAIFFSNMGYLCTATIEDFVTGFVLPANKVISIATIERLKQVFKADTQFYKDIETILMQLTNNKPNKSGVNEVIVYVGALGEGENYGNLVDEMISVNGNFARLTIDSRNVANILEAAKKAHVNNRRFIAQTSSETILNNTDNNILKQLNDLGMSLVDIDIHLDDTEALACADGAVMTQEIMGSVDGLYSDFSNVTPKKYTDTQETNMKNLYGSFYTTVTFIDGGSLDNYAQKVLLGAYTVTGIDRKSKDIEYYFDKILKARGLDFLKKKLSYQDSSANVLQEMLTRIFIEGQNNNLVIQDSIDDETGEKIYGFRLKVIKPTTLRKTNPTAFNKQKYQVKGYYFEAKTGREIEINFYVNPDDIEISELGF